MTKAELSTLLTGAFELPGMLSGRMVHWSLSAKEADALAGALANVPGTIPAPVVVAAKFALGRVFPYLRAAVVAYRTLHPRVMRPVLGADAPASGVPAPPAASPIYAAPTSPVDATIPESMGVVSAPEVEAERQRREAIIASVLRGGSA